MTRRIQRILALTLCTAIAAAHAQSYHVAQAYTLGGDGGWDYIALDTAGHRLFIARQTRIMVVDAGTGRVLAEIPGLDRAHGIAFDYASGRGFATSGADGAVVIFDLHTLAVVGRTTAAMDADAVLFDPATRHIFTMNGDAGSSSVIDPASGQRIGTIVLGGKPEYAVSAEDGNLYINIEDKAEIVEVDARAMRVRRRWALGPCESPTGLAIDRVRHVLFSGCRNRVMAISDAAAGRVVTTVPIGTGVDGCRYDPGTGYAFASNGEGSITVVREDAPHHFTVAQTVATRRGARTMEIDLATHRLYTITADFGAPPPPTPERPHPWPTMTPGTFALLVLDP